MTAIEHGRRVHVVGDGEQRGRRAICGVDAAVLPVDRFDDLFVGHPGRHGRGGGIGRLGDERRVDLADRASTAGTYYYGACVDAVTDESDTTNNCSSTVTIAVEEESTGQPDLRIVGVVAATSPYGFGPRSRIQFSVNVRTEGDANSDATTLRYYRSTDATISVSDTEVGTDEVSALVPSRRVRESINLYAPSQAGTYYYGACVDAVTGESDTTNNCSGSLAFDVN